METAVNTLWKILEENSPKEISFIKEDDPWRFLITVMLSASTTDRQAENAAEKLFESFPDPKSVANAPVDEIQRLIHCAGLSRTKAPRIKSVSAFISEHGLPDSSESLIALPGIGEKTAACYAEHVFGLPAVIADTHFIRVAKRLGFTDTADRTKAAAEIRSRFPQSIWSRMSMVINLHGRTICKSKPLCSECIVRNLCPSSDAGNAES